VIEVIMFDRIWEMLESISAGERRKAFDAIVELLSFSKDEEMLQLRDDLIAFEEDITDESEDPIKSLLENTYTKKEAAEALKVSEKTIQRAVSEGLIMPVNPGKKPLRFSVGDLRILYGNPIEKEKESKGLITQYWVNANARAQVFFSAYDQVLAEFEHLEEKAKGVVNMGDLCFASPQEDAYRFSFDGGVR